MRFTLPIKALVLFFTIAVLGFLAIAYPGKQIARLQTKKDVIEKLYGDANYLSAAYKINEGNLSQAQLETMAYASHTDIWVVSPTGNVIACTGTQDVPEIIPNFTLAKSDGGYYMTGDFFGSYEGNMISVYSALQMNVSADGYVFLHYPMNNVERDAEMKIWLAYGIYALLILLILLGMLFLQIVVTSPLSKLERAAKEYANHNLSYPVPVHSKDEIGSLAVHLEELARQLQSSGEDQHQFLANISHDFRSPLTSIRGYLVAIQDGTIPPELYDKYLNIIIKETDRLTKLANGLLDMTQLENGLMLKKTTFDINELIREVCLTLGQRVTEKNMTFELIFEEEACFVKADRPRIQQVIHNLADNAIKFSNVGSSVDISTQLHGDKVFISVTDHGIGIEKENISKIWERFYKTDISRGRDKTGTGLGLSIVREIIQAHKENIDVISTKGIGTKFIFTLPLADES